MKPFVMLAVAALALEGACAAGTEDGPSPDGGAGAGSDAGLSDGASNAPAPPSAGGGGGSGGTGPSGTAADDAGDAYDGLAKLPHDGGTAPTGPADTGVTGASNDAGSGACTLAAAAQSGIPACDSCEQSSCCALIAACLDDNAPCLALYTCTQNCDDGINPDGSSFDSSNASLVDQCWNVCEQGQATASTFEAQDNCVSSSCATPCQLD